jgi:hypothetical protein
VDGSSLLFNQVKPIERVEILSSLPHQPEVYRLISHFFNTKDFPIAVPRKPQLRNTSVSCFTDIFEQLSSMNRFLGARYKLSIYPLLPFIR